VIGPIIIIYRIAPFPITWIDPQGHLPKKLQVFSNAIFRTVLCRSSQDFMWQPVTLSLCDSWAFYGRPIGQTVIFCSCGFYLLLFFFAYSQPSQIGCLPYFHTWCGFSANLGCRSDMCCTRLAEIQDAKKSPKIRHLVTIAQISRAVFSKLRDVLTIGKKQLLNSNISSTCLTIWRTSVR